MGCVCTQDNHQLELKNEFSQYQIEIEEKFNNNLKLLKLLTKLQAIIKGRYVRNKLNKFEAKDEQLTYELIQTEIIPQEELQEVFETYPPLDDGVEVEVRGPAQFSNKVIYFGEWDKVNNLRHGRGIQLWSDGAKFFGCWKKVKPVVKENWFIQIMMFMKVIG